MCFVVWGITMYSCMKVCNYISFVFRLEVKYVLGPKQWPDNSDNAGFDGVVMMSSCRLRVRERGRRLVYGIFVSIV